MKLKQYEIKSRHTDWTCIVTVNDKTTPWRKFVSQRFGALKPNPMDYTITQVK